MSFAIVHAYIGMCVRVQLKSTQGKSLKIIKFIRSDPNLVVSVLYFV